MYEKLLASKLQKFVSEVPIIYTGSPPVLPMSYGARLLSLAISLASLLVLVVAASIKPDPHGVGTHQQLGMMECQFLLRSGIPCPSCGMTSSFAWFVRGNLLASFYVQPMGTVLAAGTAIGFWATLYLAITGKSVGRLVRLVPMRYYLPPLLTWAVLAWGWKIYIHLHGLDGWR